MQLRATLLLPLQATQQQRWQQQQHIRKQVLPRLLMILQPRVLLYLT